MECGAAGVRVAFCSRLRFCPVVICVTVPITIVVILEWTRKRLVGGPHVGRRRDVFAEGAPPDILGRALHIHKVVLRIVDRQDHATVTGCWMVGRGNHPRFVVGRRRRATRRHRRAIGPRALGRIAQSDLLTGAADPRRPLRIVVHERRRRRPLLLSVEDREPLVLILAVRLRLLPPNIPILDEGQRKAAWRHSRPTVAQAVPVAVARSRARGAAFAQEG